jgi:hypothetical protein
LELLGLREREFSGWKTMMTMTFQPGQRCLLDGVFDGPQIIQVYAILAQQFTDGRSRAARR